MLPCYVRIIFSNFAWVWFASHMYWFLKPIPKDVLAMDKLVCVIGSSVTV